MDKTGAVTAVIQLLCFASLNLKV